LSWKRTRKAKRLAAFYTPQNRLPTAAVTTFTMKFVIMAGGVLTPRSGLRLHALGLKNRTLSEVDFLLLRSVVDQMATSIDSTIAQLGDLKALGDRFLPWNEQNEISGPLGESFNSTRKAQLLENDFQQWNRQLKSFCGDQVYSMDLLLNYVLAQLRMITKLSLMTETGL